MKRSLARCSIQENLAISYGEPYVQDVALLHDVLLALDPHPPLCVKAMPASRGDDFIEGHDFGPDEPSLHVCVDHAGGLGGCGPAADVPRMGLVLVGREERDQIKGSVTGRN